MIGIARYAGSISCSLDELGRLVPCHRLILYGNLSEQQHMIL